ncbi:MAG: PAS domain-containing protein [Calothrix sp. FI2-JRJ7]|jgi:hypothetical protein|nr:PAS domain-containing protein [Calothrix sp. FI2-JRJ7]
MATFLDSITDGVIILDTQWRFIFINDLGTRIFDKGYEELIGKNVYEVWRTSVQLEAYYSQFNLWLEHNIYRSVNGISIYFRDITQRKQIEAERHELFICEQNARQEVELAQARYAFLSQAGRVLATSLDIQTTLSFYVAPLCLMVVNMYQNLLRTTHILNNIYIHT